MNDVINFLAIFSNWTLNLLVFFIFLRVILSWFPIPQGRFSGFLREVTNPVFRIFALIPFARIGFLDLTPLLAYFGLQIIGWLLQMLFLRAGANPAIYFS